jgi:hypothetical protein
MKGEYRLYGHNPLGGLAKTGEGENSPELVKNGRKNDTYPR